MKELKDSSDVDAFIEKFDTFLLDCDGVLWHGDKLIEGAPEALNKLRSKNKQLLFVTNNSTKSRKAYNKKFSSLNIKADENEIFGSSHAAAVYIRDIIQLPSDKKVYVVGMKGICEELEAEGIQWCGGEDETEQIENMGEIDKIKPDLSIGAVLLGFDVNINYTKLAKAYTYIHSNPECHFLATNDDTTFPAGGTTYPGTGALLACLTASLGKQPKVLGKPHQTMLDVIVTKHHLNRERTCMVGDRLNTDIAFGKNGGLGTLLVYTGVTSVEESRSSQIKPDYFINSFGNIYRG